MDREQLIETIKSFYQNNIDIMQAKNRDYCGAEETTDPFKNFSAVELIGICSAEQGFLTRMMDKLCRINSLLSSGQRFVQDESVEDTLKDLANYAGLLFAYLKAKREQQEKNTVVAPEPSPRRVYNGQR